MNSFCEQTFDVLGANKCNICFLLFRTTSERDSHIFNHFKRISCSICQQSLILVGDIWYSPHEHPNNDFDHSSLDIVKSELNVNDADSYQIEPVTLPDFVPFDGSNFPEELHKEPLSIKLDDSCGAFDPMAKFATLGELENNFEHKPTEIIETNYVSVESDAYEIDGEIDSLSGSSSKKVRGVCDVCNKEFACRTALKYHMNLHRGIKPYECDECGAAFADKRNLNKHKQSHNPIEKDSITGHAQINGINQTIPLEEQLNSLTCSVCTRKFANKRNLRNHMAIHDGSKYMTRDATFGDLENSFEHKPNELIDTQHISVESDVNEVDDGIGKQTSDLEMNEISATEMHTAKSIDSPREDTTKRSNKTRTRQAADDSNFNCEETDRLSGTPNKIARGVCDVCNKDFACRTSLKYHMNLHRGIKPFECDECGAAFADKRNLNKHKQLHNPIENDSIADYVEIKSVNQTILTKEQLNSLLCPVCSKKFANKRSLRDHMDIHNGSTYMCKLCNKLFRDVNTYKRHRLTVHKNVPIDEEKSAAEIIHITEDEASIAVDWICEYCNSDFEFELRLAKHIIKEHNEEKEQHPCSICEEKFNRPNDLLAHMRAHPEIHEHKCEYVGCGQEFAYKSSLGVHMDKHIRINGPIERKTQDQLADLTKLHARVELDDQNAMQEDAFSCTVCDKSFPRRTNLLSHIQNVHNKVNSWIPCTVSGCDKVFKSIPGIFSHIQSNHPDEVKTCDLCKKTFYSDEKLEEHRTRKHILTTFDCSFCDKKFTQKSRLRTHLRQHEKDVECNICNEKFISVKGMMEHREKHGKKTMYTCRFKDCNQSFESRAKCSIHTSTHTYNKKRKFICSYCGKAFSTSSYLRSHINTHTEDRPHKCLVCSKSFAKEQSLRRHKLIHTGVKPYKCPIDGCSQAYRDSIDLKRHKFRAHGIYTKKHFCSICSAVFSENKLLTKHTSVVHGKVAAGTNVSNV